LLLSCSIHCNAVSKAVFVPGIFREEFLTKKRIFFHKRLGMQLSQVVFSWLFFNSPKKYRPYFKIRMLQIHFLLGGLWCSSRPNSQHGISMPDPECGMLYLKNSDRTQATDSLGTNWNRTCLSRLLNHGTLWHTVLLRLINILTYLLIQIPIMPPVSRNLPKLTRISTDWIVSVSFVTWYWLTELLTKRRTEIWELGWFLSVWFIVRIIPKIEEYREFFAAFHEVVLQLLSVLGKCSFVPCVAG